MGDWRTLHLFDSDKYKKEIVPRVKNTSEFLSSVLDKELSTYLLGFSQSQQEIIDEIIAFIAELESDLMFHPSLRQAQQKSIKQQHFEVLKRQYLGQDNFIETHINSIEFLESILTETIFSTVANFNPHLILGKRIFESFVTATKDSVAEELIYPITESEPGSVLNLIDNGIINWLDKEEVERMADDLENVFSTQSKLSHATRYVKEFKVFVQLAYASNLGLISLRNPREEKLSKLRQTPNELQTFIDSNDFKYIITT